MNPSPMISFDIGDTTFMYRAAAVCLRDDRVLICRPRDLDFWYLPGGRVHIGESSFEALERELIEEVDSPPKPASLMWVAESFFVHDRHPFHEIGLYFRVELPDEAEALSWDHVVTRTETGDGNELEWQWLPFSDLESVDLRPPFLKQRLRSLPDTIEHVIDRRDEIKR
jgi:8-oxo-dGTP pyrophosphatase MutT (NUDIX family)